MRRKGRCLFRHRDDDAGVMTRTEEEVGVELAALWAAASKLASSMMWRTGQKVDVPMPQEKEMLKTFVVSWSKAPQSRR